MTDSPCVGICILEGDVCIGCGRTTDEIYQAGVDALQEVQEPAAIPLTPVPPTK